MNAPMRVTELNAGVFTIENYLSPAECQQRDPQQ